MHQKAQIQGLNKLEEDKLNAQVAPGMLRAPRLVKKTLRAGQVTSDCTRA